MAQQYRSNRGVPGRRRRVALYGCGTNEIGEATAEKMKKYRLVVWTNHGIYGVGKDIDEAFGLIETVEKTAQLYMLTLGHVVNEIGDDVLQGLVDLWHLTPLDGIIGK